MSSSREIHHIYRYGDAMVIVFDRQGRFLRKYYGKYVDVIDAIKQDAPDDAVMYSSKWENSWNRPIIDRSGW